MTQSRSVLAGGRQARPCLERGDAQDCPPASRGASPQPQSRILVATTLRWAVAARLAIALDSLGCKVEAWCPAGHPLEQTRAAGRLHRASVLSPQQSLRRAIRAMQPDLVVPCDDESARLLDRLYHRSRPGGPAADLHRLIGRSLGVPTSCSLASRRGELMRRAAAMGIRSPETRELSSAAMLEDWLVQYGLPTVLKVDGSWGGQGVSIVHDVEQARAAYRRAIHPSWKRSLIELVLRRDPAPLLRQLGGREPVVTAQRFIKGRVANRAAACWHGEELAGTSVVALQTNGSTGPATVVQVIDSDEMAGASRRLIRSLGLSGLVGLDFVIEEGSGDAYLIEMNPRATPICHLALGAGYDLPVALIARLRGEDPPAAVARPLHEIVALFPGEWRRDHLSPYLSTAFHDVPWQEAALVDECVALPWEQRGAVARLRAWFKPGSAPSSPAFPAR